MDRYEYRVWKMDIADVAANDFETKLNDMGREGWKLDATVQRERHGYSHELTFLFSRLLAA